MSITSMHYDFKMKFNKIDSQSNRNFLVPEIDWLLNEAARIFVTLIAEPRKSKQLGFETSLKSIEDISTIVVSDDNDWRTVTNNVATLPDDYWYLIRGRVKASKGKCIDEIGRFQIVQHDDMTEESIFYKSSFEWRRFNAHRFDGGIKFLTDGTFTINDVCFNYIRKMSYMHNAVAFRAGGYNSPLDGVLLTGSVNCELPETTHSEVVDIAVMIASGNILSSYYQQKLAKLNFNQLT